MNPERPVGADQPTLLGPDERVRLLLEARCKYEGAGNGVAYDEVVNEVAARVAATGSIGRLDMGALVA